jgi:hypothetical protein
MAHIRESFPILEDAVTKVGEALHKTQNGDASAGKVGSTTWAFKDSSGNMVHPQLTPEGKLPVDFQGAGVSKSATSDGEVAGSLTLVDICEIALTADKTYGKIHFNSSCFKEAIFYLIQVDDAVETIISHSIVGAGQYSSSIHLGEKEIVAGSTGTQKLILKAKNLSKESDFLGDIACLEFAV